MKASWLLAIAACGTTAPTEITGPFDGAQRRYTIDRFDMPGNNMELQVEGDDLNGDGTVDNRVGGLYETLVSGDDAPRNAHDLLLSGMLPTAVMIYSDELHDTTGGVSYIGRPGDTAVPVGGTFDETGIFVSNRTATDQHLAEGTIVLPLFADADPTELAIDHGEIALVPDEAGGFMGQMRGLIHADDALLSASKSLLQMITNNPSEHGLLIAYLQITGNISLGSIQQSERMRALVSPDIDRDGQQFLSIGFQFHLAPCADGTCVTGAIADHCDDRIVDEDETGIDCGGATCRACPL